MKNPQLHNNLRRPRGAKPRSSGYEAFVEFNAESMQVRVYLVSLDWTTLRGRCKRSCIHLIGFLLADYVVICKIFSIPRVCYLFSRAPKK
jgi:hypothetical protein